MKPGKVHGLEDAARRFDVAAARLADGRLFPGDDDLSEIEMLEEATELVRRTRQERAARPRR